jgi:pimeloyl-ACP methyl ester carboxylesterase
MGQVGGGGSPENSGFETLEYRTEEALAAVKYLQSRQDIQSNAVGLWGISQGGWICQMAAASYNGIAFIISISGPGVTPAEQEVYRVEAESRAAGFKDDEIAKAVLMRRLLIDGVLIEPSYREVNLRESKRLGPGPWSAMTEMVYNPKPIDPALEFGKIVEILNSNKDERWAKFLHLDQVCAMLNNLHPQVWELAKAQMRAVMEVNPADFLTEVHCPVLAVFGEKDTSILVEKSVALYKQFLREAGNKALTVEVFPHADHIIPVGERFADGYFDLMVNWLINLFDQ